MIRRRAAVVLMMVQAIVVLGPSADARAQGVSLDVSAGSVVYEAVSANIDTTNAMATMRFDARRGGWVYATAGAPLREGDPVWGAFGAGGRLLPPGSTTRRLNVGLEVGAQAFLFRDALVEQTGRGATIDAIPFVSLSSGAASVELRSGWRGQTLDFAGMSETRGVWESGTRASYGTNVRVQADARWVRASEGTYPFLGGMLSYSAASVQTWVQAGKWLSDSLEDVAWAGGVGVSLGRQSTLWASVRQETPDPLYWSATRRSWGVGLTHHFGRRVAARLPVSTSEGDAIVIRLATSEAPGTQLSIAGDFNNWEPVPMQRTGEQWSIRLTLAPGVYHYAFRAADGDWFVPESVAGRRSDGMGGYQGILVAP